jgi:hypothetical protein
VDGTDGVGRLRSHELKAAASVLASSSRVSDGEIWREGVGMSIAARIEVVVGDSAGVLTARGAGCAL